MSKRRKILHSDERILLARLMTFFEQEKKEKQLIIPFDVKDLIAMKSIARLKNENKVDTCASALPDDPDAPSEIELMLLENEKKYQTLLRPFDNVIKRTAAATGVSERTLRNIKAEEKNNTSSSPEPGTSSAQDIKLTTPKTKEIPKERNKIKREDGPSSSQVDELEVEIQVKQEINDDPLSLDKVKAEPLDDSDDTDWEPSEKTQRLDNTRDNGEPSSKIVEVSIKNEYDEALMIEENEVPIDIKKEKE